MKRKTLTPARVGLVGAGGITHVHVPGWLATGAEIVVYSEQGASELAQRYGLAVADSYEQLLARVDIVDICTPTPSHLHYADMALRAGKHVVCEKPVSLDPTAAERTARIATEADLGLYPAHVVRWFPEYVAAKNAVDRGTIGEVAIMRFTRIGEYPSWASWFADQSQSGGIVVDQMIHDLDIARWIGGEIVEVFATRSTDDAPAVSAQVMLTHANGVLSYVNGVWGAPGTTFRTSFSIAGTAGVYEYDSSDHVTYQIDTGAASAASDRPDGSFTESPYSLEIADFLAAFRGGAAPRVTWQDGIRAAEIALAANESIVTGLPVSVADEARKAVA